MKGPLAVTCCHYSLDVLFRVFLLVLTYISVALATVNLPRDFLLHYKGQVGSAAHYQGQVRGAACF